MPGVSPVHRPSRLVLGDQGLNTSPECLSDATEIRPGSDFAPGQQTGRSLGEKVAAVAVNVAEETLIEIRAKVIFYVSPEVSFHAAGNGVAGAVVFEMPVSACLIKENAAMSLMLVDPLFDYQDYGIVVAENEGLLEQINRNLLLMIEEGATQRLHSRWIGGIE